MYATMQTSGARVSKTTLVDAITSESRGMKHYALACALLVGTGGYSTTDYWTKRSDQGYRPILLNDLPGKVDNAAQTDIVRTSAENLSRIRDVLKPTITELANLFSVSRQAIYDWQAGKPTAPENAAKLDDLARAADALATTGIDGSSQLLRRKIAGNKSLLEVVREGGSAANAALVLAQVVVREAKQRERLASRLAGRAKPTVPRDDFGVPMLDERS